MNVIKRHTLMSPTPGFSGASTIKSPAAVTCKNPDFQEMKSRKLNVSERGKGLSIERKYFVLLATSSALIFPMEAKVAATAALQAGVSPIAITEAVIQTTPYLGIGRVEQVLPAVNEALEEAGIELPLELQVTVNNENRLERGIEVQASIFGERIKNNIKNTPEGHKGIMVEDLSDWCFGDFYTRNGMSIKDRELVVFSALAALGGCEFELTSHIKASIRLGFTKQDLIDALHVASPLSGFPRTRSALEVVKSVE